MTDIMATIRNMIWNLTHRIRIIDVLDILIVAVIIYELLLLTRHTRGSALLKGLFLLLIIALLSNLFGLVSLNWLLRAILQNGAVVLVVLFQPAFHLSGPDSAAGMPGCAVLPAGDAAHAVSSQRSSVRRFPCPAGSPDGI